MSLLVGTIKTSPSCRLLETKSLKVGRDQTTVRHMMRENIIFQNFKTQYTHNKEQELLTVYQIY